MAQTGAWRGQCASSRKGVCRGPQGAHKQSFKDNDLRPVKNLPGALSGNQQRPPVAGTGPEHSGIVRLDGDTRDRFVGRNKGQGRKCAHREKESTPYPADLEMSQAELLEVSSRVTCLTQRTWRRCTMVPPFWAQTGRSSQHDPGTGPAPGTHFQVHRRRLVVEACV